ncbi:DUF3606 domain-containing protein [Bradyrhizobium brasilense]|nr:DUF3606 domain-containing protein [Bradyrhizobium brasilense]
MEPNPGQLWSFLRDLWLANAFTKFELAARVGLKVSYEAKKTRTSAASVKKSVKKVGNSRKRVERRLGSAMKKSLGTAPSKRR